MAFIKIAPFTRLKGETICYAPLCLHFHELNGGLRKMPKDGCESFQAFQKSK